MTTIENAGAAPLVTPSFSEFFKTWLKIGCINLGGPAGQIAMMHRIVVDEKKWIDEPRFLHALNFCMLLPGPEAQKLATYIGWLLHGVRGGLVSGILFVLPGALVMLGLSLLYALGRGFAWVDGALFGIKAAVLVIVLEALIRIARRALKTTLLIGLSLLAFVLFLLLRKPADCLEADTHLLGNIRVGCSQFENPFPAALPDGLHGKNYTDRAAAFTLQVDEPSNWSIVQAETSAGETRPGKSAKAFKFPAGLLGAQNITILTNDGVVAFLYTKLVHQGKANLWVFRIPNQTSGVEEFIAAETDKLLRTGAVVVTLVAPLVSDPFRSKNASVYQESPTRRVQLTKMTVSPDHRNAVLQWESPVWGVNADIIARAMVGKRDIYYVIAIRVAPMAANEEKVNQQLRTMLESFRPL